MRVLAVVLLVVSIAAMVWAARGLYRLHRQWLHEKARWVDHSYVGEGGTHVTVQKVAHTRFNRHVLDEQFVALISPRDPFWGMKYRKARAEAYDRAIDLNNPPLMEG